MHPRIIFAAGFLVLFVGGGARYAIGLTFKPMVTEFGWDRGELGLAVGAYLVVSAFATYLAGYLADRMSPRLLLNTGVLISALGIGLMSLVSQPWHALLFYGVVFAIGSGLASLTPVSVIVTHAFPARTGFVNASVISGTSVGQLVMIATFARSARPNGMAAGVLGGHITHLALIPLLVFSAANPPLDHWRHRSSSVRCPRGYAHAAVLDAARDLCDLRARRLFRCHARGCVRSGPWPQHVDGGKLARADGVDGAYRFDRDRSTYSDRVGPARTAALSFAARVAVFALIAIDQSILSIVIFALVFGATFLVTAPLVVLFVRDHFGMSIWALSPA